MKGNLSPARCGAKMRASLLLATFVGALWAPFGCTPAPPPAVAPTEQGRTPRVVYLSPGVSTRSAPRDVFVEALAELGYIQDQNINVEFRFIDELGGLSLGDIAAEVVALRPQVIVALGTARVRAVREATDTIPIVMTDVVDPIEAGLVPSLARPGGNLTGVATLSPELAAKRLEVLKDTVPGLSRVAVFATPAWNNPASPAGLQWNGVQEAGNTIGVAISFHELRDQGSRPANLAAFETAIETALQQGAEAIYPLADAMFDVAYAEIAELSLKHRVPMIYRRADFAESGGLLAYGPNNVDPYRRAAALVDKIIRGAQPQDLPIELPTRFDLAVNLLTAEKLGIEIPQSVLARSTRLVQ